MDDLIERSALIKKMQKPTIEIYDGQDFADWYSDCVQNAPTVDAVPVVRCVECQLGTPNKFDGNYIQCREAVKGWVSADDYCSKGIRK